MPRITKQNFLQNKFSRSKTNQIIRILNNIIDSTTTKSELISLLADQADQYLWAVGENPAYHLQYQIDSVAILKVNNFYVIVWKPKYIEYPQMIKFPELKDTKNQSLKLEIDDKVTNLSDGNKTELISFLQSFYGNYFRSDPDFETNLVTYAKHFITKKTAVSYWHCLYDNQDSLMLRNQDQMSCIVKIRVSGIKKGYNKCLLLFSYKGQREGVLKTISKKWVETLSFLAMVLIFVSIVSCSSDDTEGYCQYRDETMIAGAGLMMSLFGLKLAKRSKNKTQIKNKAA